MSSDRDQETSDRSQGPSPRQHDQPCGQESDAEAAGLSHSLSHRGVDISAFYNSYFQAYEAYQSSKFHLDLNNLGFFHLDVSENKLCSDLMAERLCQKDMDDVEDIQLQAPNPRGHPFLREAVAQFLTSYCSAPECLFSRNVVVLNGCSAVFSALSMVLCDPGDCFLVPTPFFSGFIFGTKMCTNVELIPIHLETEITDEDTLPFQLTVGKLEQALLEAKTQCKKVKGLLLPNPQNATGHVYSQESLKEFLEFAKRNDLHVVVDEVYMLSVFDDSVQFHSVLSLERLPDPQKTYVIWSISKDFGLGLGALYTPNEDVAFAVSPFSYLHSISGIVQYHLRCLLRDRDWIDRIYLPAVHSRLRTAHAYVITTLRELEVVHNFKIFFHSRSCGLYLWINLKNLLEPCTFEEELVLYRRFLDHKLILSRGQSYLLKEPGWFRLCFAENPDKLELAMLRFGQAIAEQKQYWIQKVVQYIPELEETDSSSSDDN
ncbi:probable inactive 1-aminocyclopropane-1-carboxylate synthase-like protein 2 [Octodon degus]|uniref:Probable inactive 1-aminocyclopropane-1-carboxylate synthase-like protein 2 n=1 Tax=Octodon degus TaxID=10160 RepID=A0A6P3F167_OCTDE|nr:probable inactive 1-aminocyclopropane-1-carboxylate synthase-like protein 2 [Octodon degus]